MNHPGSFLVPSSPPVDTVHRTDVIDVHVKMCNLKIGFYQYLCLYLYKL